MIALIVQIFSLGATQIKHCKLTLKIIYVHLKGKLNLSVSVL